MKLLTAAETRTVLRIDQKTLMKIIASGALPALRIGTAKNAPLRISSKALAEYTGTPERSIVELVTRETAKPKASA
jgi:hypothetical protein